MYNSANAPYNAESITVVM